MYQRLALAAACVLMSGTAFAQSSVTLYGRLNATLERIRAPALGPDGLAIVDAAENLVYRTRQDVNNNASRIGLRGVEDLGGGLKALFLIEHGFDVDTGAQSQSRFWARESWVGLAGRLGRLRVGNMGPTAAYFTTADSISLHNHDTGTSADAFYLYAGIGTNMVAYNSPEIGGLSIEAQVSEAQSNADTLAARRTTVLAANYDRGALHLGAAFLTGPPDAFGAAFADVFGASTGKAKQYGLRGLVEVGPLTLGAYYVRDELDIQVPGAGDDGFERDSYRLSAMYAAGPMEWHANVGVVTKLKTFSVGALENSAARQYTLGANYNLSRRTKLYGFYTKVDNKPSANYVTGVPGGDFSSLGAGIRHNF